MATRAQTLDVAGDRDPRRCVRMWALVDFGGVSEHAVIRDLSTTGFGIETSRALPDGARITVTLGSCTLHTTVVRSGRDRYGCRLETPLDQRVLWTLTRDGPFAAAPPALSDALPEPFVERLPLRARSAIIVGSAAVCWGAIIGTAYLILG